MRHGYLPAVLFAIALVVCLAPGTAHAKVYAADQYPGTIYAYEDTAGVEVNPDTLFPYTAGMALDSEGRLLLAMQNGPYDVVRFDPATQETDVLDLAVSYYEAEEVAADIDNDVYVAMNLEPQRGGTQGERYVSSWLGIIRDGAGAPDTAYTFSTGSFVKDVKVWPFGERAGNILVLLDDDGAQLIELKEDTEGGFDYVQQIAGGGMMPYSATSIAISPAGTIYVLDEADGLFYVDEEYGYVWGMGGLYGPGLRDMEVGPDGTIYVADTSLDQVRRFDDWGYEIYPPFSSGLESLAAIAVTGTAPTPEGENVFVEPQDNLEITYEEVTSSGFTTAVGETTSSRVSPEGNYLPDSASLPGRASNFKYISLSTDAVYRSLIQVDVLEEGSRLFYADGIGDTFRDFTVVGSIEDARGTIPRFSEQTPGSTRDAGDPTEVVLVEDTRQLGEVTLYKFWRLSRAMEAPGDMPGSDPCPWDYIKWLRKYVRTARNHYDEGRIPQALSELSTMNSLIRSHAGWCIPDSSDDPNGNLVGKILAHSKTLMFSLNLEQGAPLTGIDGGSGLVSFAVTNPSLGSCEFALRGPVGADVTVNIYSVSGRLVAKVFDGVLVDGTASASWDGIDRSGTRVASGVYFARVESESGTTGSKLVYIR